MIAKLVVLVVSSFAPLLAQSTWVVNAAGGAGVHFLDLPTAVASPSVVDGDTILVQPGPFGAGASGFTTSKGLTIVGDGVSVPLNGGPYQVVGLPAGRTFRMAGFRRPQIQAEFPCRLINCVGAVHLDDLHAFEFGWFFPTTASIEINNCVSVTLRDVENFGSPAVQIQNSTVSLVSCRLGQTSVVGGGTAVVATNSIVDIVQPRFEPLFQPSAIVTTNCTLRIAGDANALIANGPSAASPGAAIVANGGTVTIDPAVQLVMVPPTMPPITGTAVVTFTSVPASWTTAKAQPGLTLSIRSTATPGAAVFQALGAPGLLLPTPLGLLGIDAAAPFVFFPAAVAPASGAVTSLLPVPAGLALGSTFASQSVVWDGIALQLGAPVTFTAH